MNKNFNYTQYIQRRRRLKYGSFAVALTCIVIALVVVVNIIFTSLSEKNLWYADMTESGLFDPASTTMSILEEYRTADESFEISFIFCMPEDKLKEEQAPDMVNRLVKEYVKRFDYLSVQYVDIVQNPQLLDKYQFNSQSSPSTTSLIVARGNNAIIYSAESNFFYTDEDSGDVYFIGDYSIASAVIRLTGDNPIAYFVTNHGEKVQGNALANLLYDAGYEVKGIDLTKEDPDYVNAQVMVIINPAYDYMGADEGVNEIEKLRKFLDSNGGLMVFMDSTVNETPVLNSFLEEWGIRFENKSVKDYENGMANTNGMTILAEYAKGSTVGASLVNFLSSMPNPPATILTNCRPISVLFDETQGQYFPGKGTIYASSALKTSSEKTAIATTLGTNESESGIFNLMTISSFKHYKENVVQSSYVLAAGTDAFGQTEKELKKQCRAVLEPMSFS